MLSMSPIELLGIIVAALFVYVLIVLPQEARKMRDEETPE